MIHKKLLSLFALFTIISLYSQTDTLENKYNNYFKKSREIVHLHLNKTTFLKGENIWFQAYIKEQNTQKLHAETTNLYVSIYDESGSLKDQHLIQVKNGIGKGNIKIDSSFSEKAYYIRASTKWMKNFNEDQSYSQKVIILKNIESKTEKVNQEEFYDFQLFPEGGHLLANTYNRIGILLKDANNKGIATDNGIVRTKEGQKVGSFKTNQFGIGQIFLFLKENTDYQFIATLENDIEVNTTAPAIQKIGVTLNLTNDELNNSFILNIVTNKKSLPILSDKKYTIVIHNTNEFIKDHVVFNSSKNKYSFVLNKQLLFNGINIITVFNENNKPVLERLMYNDAKEIVFKNIDAQIINKENDSLTIRLNNNTNNNVVLSASFLPVETKSYNPTNSIISSFILKPFVNGDIENAAYYFNNNNIKNKELDLLLLTQGWSKYKWHNIFNNPPSDKYNFENGIDIVMKINQKINPTKAFLIDSPENNFKGEVSFLGTKLYKIENSFFKKNSTINFAIKDGFNHFKVGPSITYSASKLYEDIKPKQIKELKETIPEYSTFPFLGEDYILLDEVTIQSKDKEEEERETRSLNNWTYRNNNSRRRYDIVSSFYDNQPYRYNFYYDNGVPNPYGALGFRGNANNWNEMRGGQEYAWGTSVVYENFGRGSAGFGYINPDFSYDLPPTKEYYTITLPVGFSASKEYYNPKYPSLQSKAFLNHGAIWWEPKIEIKSKSFYEFKITHKEQKVINIFLEGIDSEGKLFEKRKQLPLKKSEL